MPRPPRRRRVVRIVVLLLIGAAMNIAVAWVCALSAPGKVVQQSGTGTSWSYGPGMTSNEFWSTDATTDAIGLRLVTHVDLEQDSKGTFIKYNRTALDCRAGWPLRSLRGSHDSTAPASVPTLLEAPWAMATAADRRAIPLAPVPLAFIANTLLYAVVLAGVFIVPPSLRRRARRRRGRCTTCGYQLAGLTTCPECGSVTQNG
jgi:hypothetical protein